MTLVTMVLLKNQDDCHLYASLYADRQSYLSFLQAGACENTQMTSSHISPAKTSIHLYSALALISSQLVQLSLGT